MKRIAFRLLEICITTWQCLKCNEYFTSIEDKEPEFCPRCGQPIEEVFYS